MNGYWLNIIQRLVCCYITLRNIHVYCYCYMNYVKTTCIKKNENDERGCGLLNGNYKVKRTVIKGGVGEN